MRHLAAATLAIILTACASEPERLVRPRPRAQVQPPAPVREPEPAPAPQEQKSALQLKWEQAAVDNDRAREVVKNWAWSDQRTNPRISSLEQNLREPARLNRDPYQPPEMPEGVAGIEWMQSHFIEYSEWQRNHPKPPEPPCWPPYKATYPGDLMEELGVMPEQLRASAIIRQASADRDGLERASLMNAIRDSKGNLSTYDAACQAYEKAMVRLIAKERARAQEVEDEKAKLQIYEQAFRKYYNQ